MGGYAGQVEHMAPVAAQWRVEHRAIGNRVVAAKQGEYGNALAAWGQVLAIGTVVPDAC